MIKRILIADITAQWQEHRKKCLLQCNKPVKLPTHCRDCGYYIASKSTPKERGGLSVCYSV